ncbi:MAG TPA: biotin/lipoyl-containing protein, partial [Candidatus Sulfotelmatobacter sp.]|nr:biotin/lipoyl-containing protein [Candidatus Sulfotelmatobacter sp.]
TRAGALATLADALRTTRTLGVTTNRGFLGRALAWPEVRRGRVTTDTLAARWEPADEPLPDWVWGTAAAALAAIASPASAGPPPGFRLNGPPQVPVAIGEASRLVAVAGAPDHAADWAPRRDGTLVLDVAGRAVAARLAPPPTIAAALRHAAPAAHGEVIAASLPGIVVAVRVAAGEPVAAGQLLLILEAMKMEHPVRAATAGTVGRVEVQAGQAVQRGDVLVRLT